MGYTPTFRKPVGIKPKYPVAMRPGKNGVMKQELEDESLRMFKKLFPIHSNRRIAEWFGLSFSSIQRFKRELGLEKNMTAISREHGRDVRKANIANGFYASLKGRRPCEAAIEATKKLRAEGFHPLLALKKQNPRKYKQAMQKRGEMRRETCKRERIRVFYGLDQHTKLRVSITPLSNTAASQKHAMIHDNNYFADPDHPSWVCYDSETRRSARREATAIRHGLRIVEGED